MSHPRTQCTSHSAPLARPSPTALTSLQPATRRTPSSEGLPVESMPPTMPPPPSTPLTPHAGPRRWLQLPCRGAPLGSEGQD